MTKNAVARRYASALFNLLDTSTIAAGRAGLQALSKALQESVTLRNVLASPAFDLQEKSNVLATMSDRLRCPPIMKDFLDQLLKKNRADIIPEISEAFDELADQQEQIQKVSVTSAQKLDSAQQQRLAKDLGNYLKQKVQLTFETEPSLISGLQIRIGSKVFDSTVRGRLTRMGGLLVKG